MLIREGKLVYNDKSSLMMDYFTKQLNYAPPEFCNPFDFALTVLQDSSSTPTELNDKYNSFQLEKISKERNEYHSKYHLTSISELSKETQVSMPWFREFGLLLQRSTMDYFRNSSVFYSKLFQYFMNSLILMGFYFGIGEKDNLFYNLLGYCFNTTNNFFITGLFAALFMVPVVRKVLKREYSAKMYRVTTFYTQFMILILLPALLYSVIYVSILYFAIQIENSFKSFIIHLALNFFLFSFAECFGTMCGAFFGDQLGLIISPLFFVLFLLGSGFFRSNDSFPSAFRWLNYISPYRYMIELYLYLQKDFNQITSIVAEKMGYTIGVGNCIGILGGYFAVIVLLGFIGVRAFATKF